MPGGDQTLGELERGILRLEPQSLGHMAVRGQTAHAGIGIAQAAQMRLVVVRSSHVFSLVYKRPLIKKIIERNTCCVLRINGGQLFRKSEQTEVAAASNI